MEFKDYYQTLGVARSATADEIKKAYRKLAHKYHPDVSKEADAESRFKEVGEAYEVLKDPEKRSAYDQFGSQWKAGQEFHPPPNWGAGSHGFEFRGGVNGSGFSDFFDALFGGLGTAQGAAHAGARRRAGGQSAERNRNADHHAKIEVDLTEAYSGATRTITLSSGGNAQQQQGNRSLNVKIPKGIMAGQRIRLAGQGALGFNGTSGDLYLEISFRPHPLYRADGKDIYLDLPIAPWEAALGGTITVPTLGGRVELQIPAGAQSGQKMRLKGRGLPGQASGQEAGDQYVILKLVTPAAETDTARAFYEKMAIELPFNPRASLGV